MIFRRQTVPVLVLPQFYIVLAVSLLVIPLKWLLGWFFAAAFHELGHYLALRICRCPIYSIQIGLTGAAMVTAPMSSATELICSISGPLFGACLLLLSKQFPVLAVCAFTQTAYNLFPVYPMDGGRVLRCVLKYLLPERTAIRISNVISFALYGAGAVLLMVVCIRLSAPALLLLIGIVFAFKYYRGKSSCNGRHYAVQ